MAAKAHTGGSDDDNGREYNSSIKTTKTLGFQKKIGTAAAVSLLLLISACTKEASTPAPTVQVSEEPAPTPTVTVAPTPTEMPPKVDLTWEWEDIAGIFHESPESLANDFDGEHSKSRYLIFSGTKVFDPVSTYPISKEQLEESNIIETLNDGFQSNLSVKGKEILKQAFLYQLDPNKPREEQRIDVYAYVKNGCVYLKNGALVVIRKADNERGFDVRIYEQENIPWDEIPLEYWGNIGDGDTLVDMSGDEIFCNCNINDVRSPSPEE